jgi:hypothetical protein
MRNSAKPAIAGLPGYSRIHAACATGNGAEMRAPLPFFSKQNNASCPCTAKGGLRSAYFVVFFSRAFLTEIA